MSGDFTGVVGILEEGGRILHVANDRRLEGAPRICWDLPGGGVETGESLHEALRREFLEEAGLEIEPGPLAFVIERFGMRTAELSERSRFFVFFVNRSARSLAVAPEPRDPEILDCTWLTPEEMHLRCPEVYQRVILDWLASGRRREYFVLRHVTPFAMPEDVGGAPDFLRHPG